MLSVIFSFIDWLIPERSRRSKADLGRARAFIVTHLVGPTSGASIVAYLFVADPRPGVHVLLIALGIASFWLLPLLLRWTGDLRMVAMISVQTLIGVTLLGLYNYGGVSSPFLPWLLIALANGFFYLSDRPLTVLSTFAVNLSIYLVIWLVVGEPPSRIPMEKMTGVGLVSVISATLYMAGLAIYYGLLLTSESALEHEVRRHRQTATRLAEAKDKAEKANRDKSAFLAKMSHELRTPLNAVIGYSEILQEDAQDIADVQRAKDLARINAAGKHLLSMLTDVLNISRIESDLVELELTDFAIVRMIDDVVSTSKPLADANGNTIIVNVDPAIGRMVSDEVRLRQAALNLISNAAKFTLDGVITLSARRFRLEANDWIELAVKDTGVGISATDLKTLFQDFRQIRSAQGSSSNGSGLGLALSRKLCTLMGGDISAESEPGHGACFTIRVPAAVHIKADEKRSSELTTIWSVAA